MRSAVGHGLLLLLALLLASHGLRSGLPTLSVHHVAVDGKPHCGCGCDCAEHPSSAGSCLNPLTREIGCDCRQEHRREWSAPAPQLPEYLPAPAPPLTPQPRPAGSLALPPPQATVAPLLRDPDPPH
jgi:hypothetical protein